MSPSPDPFFVVPPRKPRGDYVPRQSAPWERPPFGDVPGVVPVELVLAQNADVAIAVTSIAAYPTGLALDLVAMSRLDERGVGILRYPSGEIDDTQDVALRFGVEYADGRRATSLDPWNGGREADAPVLRSSGGGGSDHRRSEDYWLWPLPEAGHLDLVVEWPVHGIPLTRRTVDGDALRAAAGRARRIFSADHLPRWDEAPPGEGWAAYVPGV
ncbi:hypothetical protein [Patulibacter sp. SYSU D01012]|uniref:hypothetical protein n=1 Tax=Patulibacter sp. SYSU D01012 TaxID=2817381 RepID=UPI001B30068F|nr:hypothetical protein [Patulibacter sp. SYSU D01012]